MHKKNMSYKYEQLKKEFEELKEEYKNEVDENLKLSELWCKSQTNWNELKEWIVEMINEIKTNDIYDRTEYECTQIATLESVLAKVEEIESRK